MKTCTFTLRILALSASLGLLMSFNAHAQVGIIEQATSVTLKADTTRRGVAAGAIIGGVRDTNNRGASVAKGALVGGALGRRNSPTKPGMQYVIRTGPDNLITVVSDQVTLSKGDCVSVQKSTEKTSVARVDSKQCASITAAAKPAAKTDKSTKSSGGDACAKAKQEVSAATTKEALDFAKQKMDALCK